VLQLFDAENMQPRHQGGRWLVLHSLSLIILVHAGHLLFASHARDGRIQREKPYDLYHIVHQNALARVVNLKTSYWVSDVKHANDHANLL
jgi:hypothetical protein